MSVTDEDRKAATRLVMERGFRSWSTHQHIEGIAAALADERERVRAPFLALAEELDREGQMVVHNGTMNRHSHITRRIRRAAEAS